MSSNPLGLGIPALMKRQRDPGPPRRRRRAQRETRLTLAPTPAKQPLIARLLGKGRPGSPPTGQTATPRMSPTITPVPSSEGAG